MPLSVNKTLCLREAFLTVFGSEESSCSLDTGGFIFNSLGAIPVIGTVIGIIRLLNLPEVDNHPSLSEDKFHNICLKVFSAIRAVLEILGLGIICWLIDIIVNCGRYIYRSLNKREGIFL